MKIEAADPELRDLASKVFLVAEWLSGDKPIFQKSSGWYKCGDPILVWIYLTGRQAKKHPVNSILITATKSDTESTERMGNNMYGIKSPEFVLKSGDLHSFACFLEFIGRVFKVRNPG